MWPSKNAQGEMASDEARPGAHAITGRDTTDEDYARDADSRTIAVGSRVIPRAGCEPPSLRDGTLRPVGRVERVVRSLRPGRPVLVWADFPLRSNPDETRRLCFPAESLVVCGKASRAPR